MSQLIDRGAKHAAVVCCFLITIRLAQASEAPDAAINPVSGSIELTDVVSDDGQSEIRYVEKPGGGEAPGAVLLSDSAASDLGPRIDVDADGDTRVVWWRDSATPEVLYRVRDLATGSWSDEARISAEGEMARHPKIAHDGSTTWIAYESNATFGTALEITHTDDGPQPIPPGTVIATTTFGGDRDVSIRAESGHVWVTWIDSATQVAWSEYDPNSGAWSQPTRMSTAGSSVDSARSAIRSTVLGE